MRPLVTVYGQVAQFCPQRKEPGRKRLLEKLKNDPGLDQLTDIALRGFLAENPKSNDGSLSTAQLNHVIGEGKKAADKAWSDDWTLLSLPTSIKCVQFE